MTKQKFMRVIYYELWKYWSWIYIYIYNFITFPDSFSVYSDERIDKGVGRGGGGLKNNSLGMNIF